MGIHLYELHGDNRLVFTGANLAADRILGVNHSKFVGLTLEEAFPPLAQTEVPERYRDACRSQLIWQTEQIDYQDDKIAGAFEVYAFNTGVNQMAAFFLDVTERKETERQHRQLEKMLEQAHKSEAIATLAGGVAHDFNNLLMGIQGRASLIYMDLTPGHPYMEHTTAISDYVRSATALTKQLLGFARGGKYQVKPIDLNQLIQTSSTMFGRTRKEIRIHSNLHSSQLVVEVDFRQIEQVLLNMYVNAWQAMPTGGDLYLASSIVTLDDAYCRLHQVEPGRYAKVSITDTGIGMSEAVRRQVFDPFFTTKEKARGTGLGLASSYGIVKNHNGLITVYSEIGQGSTFNIFLPLSVKSVSTELPSEEHPLSGSETILLVDDEQMIIDVGQAMIEKLGYRVLIAKGGHAAIDCVRSHGSQIDLMILDLIMPDMDGGKLFDVVRQMAPQIPILLCSGYAKNQKANDILQRGADGFIQKPFNVFELSQHLRNILDRST
jgi:signal transduction histidine kinase/CheY-like chemotaxis protein